MNCCECVWGGDANPRQRSAFLLPSLRGSMASCGAIGSGSALSRNGTSPRDARDAEGAGMKQQFHNPATAAEKAEQLRNERKLREEAAPSTFFEMARAGVDLTLSGEGSAAGYVTGSEPFVRYPAAAPGYSGGPQPGLEPSLGVPIDALEPVGTPAEVAASAAELSPTAASAALSDPAPGVDSAAIHDRLNQLFAKAL
jgi:hypothetical protein